MYVTSLCYRGVTLGDGPLELWRWTQCCGEWLCEPNEKRADEAGLGENRAPNPETSDLQVSVGSISVRPQARDSRVPGPFPLFVGKGIVLLIYPLSGFAVMTFK